MQYFSEKTKKLYPTEKELHVAEKEFDDKAAKIELKRKERAARAQEVDAAIKKAEELLRAFNKDYGPYHTSLDIKAKEDFINLFDIFFPFNLF